ncbi:MAG: GDP-mannose 4,6-dehydratase, partial [bacterium]
MDLKNKRVLVTGSDGFIGSHLVERLLDEGCNVKAFVYYNSFNSWGWLDTLPKDFLNKIE